MPVYNVVCQENRYDDRRDKIQARHFILGLTIATYDWSLPTALYSLGIQWLPNSDTLLIKAGLARKGFHGTITHTLFFAFAISGIVFIFSVRYDIITLANLVLHPFADLPNNSDSLIVDSCQPE